jgi:hypothetical protein
MVGISEGEFMRINFFKGTHNECLGSRWRFVLEFYHHDNSVGGPAIVLHQNVVRYCGQGDSTNLSSFLKTNE